jgi:hypothetical protein
VAHDALCVQIFFPGSDAKDHNRRARRGPFWRRIGDHILYGLVRHLLGRQERILDKRNLKEREKRGRRGQLRLKRNVMEKRKGQRVILKVQKNHARK